MGLEGGSRPSSPISQVGNILHRLHGRHCHGVVGCETCGL